MVHISFWFKLMMYIYGAEMYILQGKTQMLYTSLARRLD